MSNDYNRYKRANEWTFAELEELEKRYPNADLLALSEDLGRSVKAIFTKASEQKIKRLANNSVVGGQKFCSMCKKFHPVEEFYRNKRQPDGYEYYCKE